MRKAPSRHNPLYYFERQGVFAVLGTAVMLLVSKFNYQRLRGAGRALIYVSVIFLILVIIPHNPIAVTAKGATRWLKIGVQFQPSEIAKVAIITYFADSISRKKDKMRSFRYGVLPYAFILVVVAGLVAVEPHLSGAILILGAGAAMMLVGGINWVWVGAAAGAAVGMVYVALFVIGYNTSRVIYWLNPWADAADKGYQLSPEPDYHRLRRVVGTGSWQEPAEVPVSAGGAQRFHFLHRLRGIGSGGRRDHHAAVRGADPPGLLDRPPHP